MAITSTFNPGLGVLDTFGDVNDNTITMSRIVHDNEILSGSLQISVTAKKWPNGVAETKGPYPVGSNTEYTDVRVKGRQMQVRTESSGTNDDWRFGKTRYDTSGGTLR